MKLRLVLIVVGLFCVAMVAGMQPDYPTIEAAYEIGSPVADAPATTEAAPSTTEVEQTKAEKRRERKAAERAERRAEQEVAVTEIVLPSDPTKAHVAWKAAHQYGWHGSEWDALEDLIQRESEWNWQAVNPTSSARGLFQFMSFTAEDYGIDHPVLTGRWASLEVQTDAGLLYIFNRYGSPSAALEWWLARVPINGEDVGHWY